VTTPGEHINHDQKTGIDIVRRTLVTPAKQIIDNAGGDGAVVLGKQLSKIGSMAMWQSLFCGKRLGLDMGFRRLPILSYRRDRTS
jgi:chaperonin GroEL (HSP60 family)